MADAPRALRLWGGLLAVQFFFGTLSVAGKIVFAELSPTAVAALRVASATVVLVLLESFLVKRDRPRPGVREMGPLAIFALLGVVLNQLLFLEGLARTTAVNATLLVTTIPAFTVLVALALGRERPTRARVAGIVLSMVGVTLLVGWDALDLGARFLLGNLMVVANSLSYSVYLVLSRPMLQRYDPLTIVTYTFLFGTAFMLAPGVPAILATDFAAVSGATWLALAWIVLFATVATYALNNWVLRHLDSGAVAAFIPLQPLVAGLLAVPVLGETLRLRTAVAGALILGGVLIAARAERSRRAGKPI